MKESFDGTKGVNIGGRHIEGINFADDMAVVAENAKVLRETKIGSKQKLCNEDKCK